MGPPEEAAVRRSLAIAHRILFVAGHEHYVWGHASVRVDEARVLVKMSGRGLDEVTPEDIAVMDLDGAQIAGRGRLHTEMPLHNEIYRARSDVRAVVHTHPESVVTRTLLGRGAFGAGPYVQDDVTFADGFGWYPSAELVNERPQGRALARALGRRRVVVLANHGLVTVGDTIEQATARAVLFERAVRIRSAAGLLAHSGRRRLQRIPPSAARRMRAMFEAQRGRDETLWAYLEREVVRELGAVEW